MATKLCFILTALLNSALCNPLVQPTVCESSSNMYNAALLPNLSSAAVYEAGLGGVSPTIYENTPNVGIGLSGFGGLGCFGGLGGIGFGLGLPHSALNSATMVGETTPNIHAHIGSVGIGIPAIAPAVCEKVPNVSPHSGLGYLSSLGLQGIPFPYAMPGAAFYESLPNLPYPYGIGLGHPLGLSNMGPTVCESPNVLSYNGLGMGINGLGLPVGLGQMPFL